MNVPAETPRFAFIMEQTLGHVTHYRNLRSTIDAEPSVNPTWIPLAFPAHGTLETLPGLRDNWSARASLRARRVLARRHAASTYQALFFHTQVTALLSTGLMRRVPSVVSLDATPINYDCVGSGYGHRASGRLAEGLKLAINRRPLLAARALITWCDWARRSLIDDYGVSAERITVIPPGVPLTQWPAPRVRPNTGPLRILFVGADFARKGGEDLLLAAAQLPRPVEVHLVTKADLPERPGVRVYRDLAPNSDLLKRLYAEADIFVLPTRADCFPLVIQEAMAAGLPVIATNVGAIGEVVIPDRTGLLVPSGNPQALASAMGALDNDRSRRTAMGQEARRLAEQRFDSAANARRILAIMHGLVEEHRREARDP
ncbi:MAG TPA: glycosyltransferase family 4 protein [Chloroflexota bacterium]|nr:glycosyltransferase family 4 protein [Chloroflexota bacterium]